MTLELFIGDNSLKTEWNVTRFAALCFLVPTNTSKENEEGRRIYAAALLHIHTKILTQVTYIQSS